MSLEEFIAVASGEANKRRLHVAVPVYTPLSPEFPRLHALGGLNAALRRRVEEQEYAAAFALVNAVASPIASAAASALVNAAASPIANANVCFLGEFANGNHTVSRQLHRRAVHA